MSRMNLIRPMRQALSRPIAVQPRHVLPALMSTRSQTSVAEPEAGKLQLTNELPDPIDEQIRLPRSVQALYLQPLRRETEYGVPSCDLQLRSFSIPNLEFFCDFALRAAYYLNLPAFGPIPLPKITERWTVPRSHFIFKKSQENFERITRRRLIQIRDGHPETVQVWLAFLQKHAYYGIGMKANMWEYSPLNTSKQMNSEMESMKKSIDEKMESLAQGRFRGTVEKVKEILASERFKQPLDRVQYRTRAKRLRDPTMRTSCRRLPVSASRRFLTSAQRRGISSTGEQDSQSDQEIPDPSSENSQTSQTNKHAVIFSGIQPTGTPHLGNYLGAMRQWKRLQDAAGEGDKLFFSIVDLHAITMPQDPEALRQRRREMLAALLAIGLDPEKSTLFYQSSVMQHSELMWILSCTASLGYLGRMTQYKSKIMADNKQGGVGKAIETRLKLGLFSYPVLQAADILVHRATHVPVGDDQRQHLEFARECVTNFNHAYKQDILVPPETITNHLPRVMSLQNPDEKMSKSSLNKKSRILITDTEEEIRKQIMTAVTDSLNEVTYEPETRRGVANLLEILAQCSDNGSGKEMAPEDVADSLNAHPGKAPRLVDLKTRCADAIIVELEGVRERYHKLFARDGGKYLDEVEAAGAAVARQSAEETMRLVRSAVGLSSI
ncbi:hypothetical protein GGR51DRAFT_555680 [Nemania sp. FL0031]|nr:hypothetical protein GGR51DRAFT_555680 [Nemania sp. FL0031]